jgi:hypothetical protein
MTQDAIGESRHLSPCPAGSDDLELARIRQLREAMALSPKELIAKLNAASPETRLADDHGNDRPGDELPQGVAGIPALAEFASIVTAFEHNPLPPFRAAPAAVLPHLARTSIAPPNNKQPQASHAEEPMPSRSAWQASGDKDRQAGRQLYAAGLGLLAGLALVVAALLWLGGWLDAQRRSKLREPAAATEKSARLGDGATLRSSAAKPEMARPDDMISPSLPGARRGLDRPAAAVTTPPAPELLVQQALRRIERGDVAGARDLLAGAGNDPRGLLSFTLAETYDPNMLAAWGMRGVSADIEKAKGLYGEALARGHAAARRRLDSLK